MPSCFEPRDLPIFYTARCRNDAINSDSPGKIFPLPN